MSVAQAVKELRKEIEDGIAPDQALGMLADEYTLNPLLLKRKFFESYGKVPQEWVITPKSPLPGITDLAMQEARKWSGEYRSIHQHFGKPFYFKGERFIFVVVQSGSPKWGIKAIRTKDAARRQITCSSWNSIVAQF